MDTVKILVEQLSIMAIYMAIGFVLSKIKLVSKDNAAAYSVLILYVTLPCVIINSFMKDASAQVSTMLALTFGISLLLLFLAMGISTLTLKHPIDIFSASFSNAGFFGISIIGSLFGTDAIFYTASFVALLNILQWT